MASTISFNPYLTTNAENSFLLQTDGFVSGTFLDNPANRYQLEGGVVDSTQSTPLYGGLPITLTVQAPSSGGASSGLGQHAIAAASSGANIEAWVLFNQASAGVITTSSPCPLYPSGSSVNFARVGSGMWVVLPVHSTVVDSIAGGLANQDLYWDFTNNYVTTSGTGALGYQIIALNTNSKVATYNSGTGFCTWNDAGSVIVVRI